MDNVFIQLAVILSLCSALGFLVYKLKLPLVIAYLTGGLILAALATLDINEFSALSFLPDIGIAFLLFLVGMELDLREIKNFGRQVLSAGILQVIITSVLGTFIAQSFGFKLPEAVYLGIGLSFSSTIVAVKLLLDKKELSSLYGKLSVGVLLVEDLLAVIVLLGLTSSISLVNMSSEAVSPVLAFFLKTLILFVSAGFIHRFLLSRIFKAVSDSGELLFLTALAWCFFYISMAVLMGFSILIGAFLAGVALATSPYHYQIQGKIRPMRDFFVALFFVYLGTKVNFSVIGNVFPLIIIFTAYAVLVKPAIILLVLGIFGFRKHTMFHTAISLSQISEFSLIVLLVGLELGFISQAGLTVIALSTVISMTISSFIIFKSNELYHVVSKAIGFFERKNKLHVLEEGREKGLENHAVIIGAHRVGGELVRLLKREKIPMVVLDFNPHVVEMMLLENIPVIYGDVGDPEVLDILNLDKARIIVSTSADNHDNRLLLSNIKLRHINVPAIVRAETLKEAAALYKAGADFVIIPEILAGDELTDIIRDHLGDKGYFNDRARIELEKLSRKTLAWG